LLTDISTGSVEQSPDHGSKGGKNPRFKRPGFRLTPGSFGAFPPYDQRALWNTGISCGKGYVTLSVLRSLWQAVQKKCR